MLNLRTCVAVLLVGGLASAQTPTSSPCPRGQDLREDRYDTTSIKSQGCVGQDSELNYRRQGHWEFFRQNGQKRLEVTYFYGELDGLATAWYVNGQKSQEAMFLDGKQEGLTTLWHENGQKSSEATYRDGLLEGLATRWHENGQKEYEATYLNGTTTSVTAWDENGTQIR